MRFDSKVKKFQVGLMAVVAAAVLLELAFVFSSPFTAEDFSIATPPTSESSTNGAVPAGTDSYPALPEPALRTLDGVVYHG
jgi:hypothetical protein